MTFFEPSLKPEVYTAATTSLLLLTPCSVNLERRSGQNLLTALTHRAYFVSIML